MEKISFSALLVQSWRLSFARPRLFFFGFCVALPLAGQFFLPFHDALGVTTLVRLITSHPLSSVAILVCSFLLTLFGKSQLIPALYTEYRLDHSQEKNQPLSHRFLNMRKILMFESVFYLFILLLIMILSLPSLASLVILKNVPDTLMLLALLVAFPIVLILFFVREFSLFYFLLSSLRLSSSFERGFSLFIQKRSPALFLGVLYFFISTLFTFSLNLVMLGGVVLFREFHIIESAAVASFLISLPCFAWYSVFSQSLWLIFFVEIATPKEMFPEKTLLFEDKTSELPLT